MDDDLLKKIEAAKETRIEIVDPSGGQIELTHGKEHETHTIKTLSELYGPGNSETVDPQSDLFMPLFLCIEEGISIFDAKEGPLTDAQVALALDDLSMNPEKPSASPLVQHIQLALRLTLSLNNYSRQEVRQAIRRIGRSVQRHSEGGRGRGYLNFIKEFLQPGRY